MQIIENKCIFKCLKTISQIGETISAKSKATNWKKIIRLKKALLLQQSLKFYKFTKLSVVSSL